MVPHLEADNPIKRRIVEEPALLYLLAVEPFVVMLPDKLEDRIGGVESLNPYFAFRAFASRPASHLLQHLVSPFIGTEIRLVEERVGIEHRHQTHIIEMQSLGDHLRTDEDVAFMIGKGVDDIFIG